MGYLPAGVADMLRGSVNLGVFFRLDSTPPLHLWLGTTDRRIGVQSTGMFAGEESVYTGAGMLLDLPDLEVMLNGLAKQITLSLSVEESLYKRFLTGLDEAPPEVRGAPAMVGFAPLDERWQPRCGIIPLWCGSGDFSTIEFEPAETIDGSATMKISLTLSTGDSSRAQPRALTFTDAAQRALHSTDRFFERVSRYVQTHFISWPRF